MSDKYFPFEDESVNSTMGYTQYNFDNEIEINNYINQNIQEDLDTLFPNSVNNNPLNFTSTNNNNIYDYPQNNSVLRLRLQQEPKYQQIKTNSVVVLPLSKVNKEQKLNKAPFNYKKYFSNDFDPNFWKQFYPKEEPFFNYEYDDNSLKEIRLKSRNKENPNIIETYEGQANENNEKHGLGKLTTPEKIIMGHWRNNQFTGWGREINKNREIYEGKFVNGMLNGKGMYSNGKEYFVGEFRNKKILGFGEIFTDKYHYYGQLWNKIPNGKGKIHIYNEGTYEGDFEYGEMDGNGLFKWNNGNYYLGEMKKGKMNGKGKLVHRNGFIENGYFRDGYFITEN